MGDFNINTLDYSKNTTIKNFINFMFQNGTVPVINKPTRVTNKSITCIDHIYINSFYNQDMSAGIIKTDISDHFPIFIVDNNINLTAFPRKLTKKIRIINNSRILSFKNELSSVNWDFVTLCQSVDDSYDSFLRKLLVIYNSHFPIKEIQIATKSLLSPWMTKGLLKSSKKKKNCTINILKTKLF